MNQKVITRFPPSPTGPLHIGNVRSALFNYFFTRQQGGQFVVRVEDTDKARSKKEYEEDMLESLTWLGLTRDGDLWHQSERTEVYTSYLHTLIEKGKAYISHETGGENKEVVRFKNPNKTITFEDMIRGTVTFDTTELGDFIIARNITDPVYHLAVVVDDFETGVTHVIRGEDHISNTPRHVLIQEAIGAPRPIYAHLPLMLAPDRSKLSKRKHGEAVSLAYYRKKGYLAEAMVNYMALVGWHPEGENEFLSMDELIQQFNIFKVQKGGAIFDIQKLNSVNKEYLHKLSDQVFFDEIQKFIPVTIIESPLYSEKLVKQILPLLRDRIQVFFEVEELLTGELVFLFKEIQYEAGGLIWKKGGNREDTILYLQEIINRLKDIQDNVFDQESIKGALMSFAEEKGKGFVLWPMRYALTGQERSPDPFISAQILGKQESIKRIENAISLLQNQ